MKRLYILTLAAVGSAMSASATGITYSGIQNIVIQGIPGTTQVLNLELAGVASPSDTLNLAVTDFPSYGDPYGATNTMVLGIEEVALTMGSSPVAVALNLGDPYPSNPLFGSGSVVLYGFGFGPHDGDFFYPLESETSYLTGWIHILIQNSNASNESITVVDWAVTNVPGQTLAMGTVPEPGTLLLTASALCLGLISTRRRCGWPL